MTTQPPKTLESPKLDDEVENRLIRACSVSECDGHSCLPGVGSHVFEGFRTFLAQEIPLAEKRGEKRETNRILSAFVEALGEIKDSDTITGVEMKRVISEVEKLIRENKRL